MEKLEYILEAFQKLRNTGKVHTKRDFANLLGINASNLSRALSGDERYLTDNLIDKVKNVLDGKTLVPEEWVKDFPSLDSSADTQPDGAEYIPVVPTEAMAGSLSEFSESVKMYDCERMLSPIKGVDYAIKVSGDSMSPEYPNGSVILIKQINEKAFIEWGKVYVLDTENGTIIKKVRRTDRDNVIECVSINPEFQPFTVETAFINRWFRVIMVLSLK